MGVAASRKDSKIDNDLTTLSLQKSGIREDVQGSVAIVPEKEAKSRNFICGL
jgi:hypothetical protein